MIFQVSSQSELKLADYTYMLIEACGRLKTESGYCLIVGGFFCMVNEIYHKIIIVADYSE